MKKAFTACVFILLIMGVASPGFAKQEYITLDSTINSGGNYSDGINLFFETGTYEVSVVSDAWNPWFNSTGVSGCDSSGANCDTGWMWSMDIYQPDTSTYFRLGSKTDKYADASMAYSAHAGDYLTIDQTSDGDLWFFIKDGNPSDGQNFVWDNSGSVTASISSTSISTAVAPEPISSLLFVIGGATFGLRRFWGKK